MKCFVIPIFPLLITLVAITADPIKDVFPGQEYDVWHDNFVRRFYGPWTILRKADGDYVNYGDYGARIQDYQANPEDVPAEEPPTDFQSNYGNGPSGSPDFGSQAGDYGSPVNVAAFDTGIQADVTSENDGDNGTASDPQGYVNVGQQSDDGEEDGAQENHDAEGNVQWTAV